jgi:hypothetical protein
METKQTFNFSRGESELEGEFNEGVSKIMKEATIKDVSSTGGMLKKRKDLECVSSSRRIFDIIDLVRKSA